MENKENVINADSKPEVVNDAIKDEVLQLADEIENESEELMKLISDPRVIKAYRAARNAGNRTPVSKSEKKKKKAKRRMAKKSKR